ncbi:MAG TPA: PAS domain S-box protein, partial [Candidatus Wallbacteria bacterium]|nr:PAS domain S-box protein [Candidatus Wallbacteria bacterium]
RVRHANGAWYWHTSSGVPLKDDDGMILGFYGIARDITERKRAEDELLASRRQLKDIIEFLPDATLAIDDKKQIIIWNKAIEKMTGVPASEMLGKGDYCYAVPFYGTARQSLMSFIFSERGEIDARYSNVVREGDTLVVEVFCNALYGNKGAWVLAKASPLHDQSGNVIGAIESIRDITERKLAEAALMESEQLHRSLLGGSPDIIVITDLEGRVLKISNVVLAKFGYDSESELTGRLITEFIAVEDRERVMSDIALMFKGVMTGPDEYHGLRKDGSTFDIEGDSEFIRDLDGRPAKIVIIARDITERKLAEEKIKDLLAEKQIMLKEVHHRIKNNMNTVAGLMLLQTDALKDPAAVAALMDARSRVISMMLLYDKLYRSDDFKEMSFSEYISPLVDEIVDNFPNKSIVKIEKQIDAFMLDAKRLSYLGIIINELLTNIMKYAFKGLSSGAINVFAQKKEDLVTIVVGDNGVGLPVSVDLASSGGFGLQLVDMMIRQLRGTIRIERCKGTKFVLEFNLR